MLALHRKRHHRPLPRRAPASCKAGARCAVWPRPRSSTCVDWSKTRLRPALIYAKLSNRPLLYLIQYRSLSTAAAGGAAALADVAAARGPHLRAAVQAERSVGAASLLGLDQLHRTVRGGRRPGAGIGCRV